MADQTSKNFKHSATTVPGPPLLSISDIDQAVVDLFDKRFNFNLPSIRQRNQQSTSNKKVPIVFSGGELFFLDAKNEQHLRDENGAVIPPIISITRRNISKSDYNGLEIPKYISTIVHRRETPTGARKMKAPNSRGIIIGKNSDEVKYQSIDFILQPRPNYVGISYEVIYWTQYQEHMNLLMSWTLDGLDAPKMFYLQLENGWKVECMFDGEFSYQSNVDNYMETERIIKYSFNLKVNAPIREQSGVNHLIYKTESPRTLKFTIEDADPVMQLDLEGALEYLKFSNIHRNPNEIPNEAMLSPQDMNPARRPRRKAVKISDFNTPLLDPMRLKELLGYQQVVAQGKEYQISERIKTRRKKESTIYFKDKEVTDYIYNPRVVVTKKY